MKMLIYIVIGLPVLFIIFHTLLRIISVFHKFPMPSWMAEVIDNPLRRRLQPPDETAVRHGIEPGMRVLEIGPGNGTYTMAAARRVGDDGLVIVADIQFDIARLVLRRAEKERISNLKTLITDVHNLSFNDDFVDAVYMITVIGEIPGPDGAIREFYRVLRPGGTLAFSELFWDPDFPRPKTLIHRATAAGFRLREKIGGFYYYTLIFEKPVS
jgi:ubiquinone/menaquinone biosynthesis C-methylase UbiE